MELELTEHVKRLVPVEHKEDLSSWREELDFYYREMENFNQMEPDEIFMKLSSFSARASFIRSQIMRVQNRPMTAFRTGEIDPFLSECDRQFKACSRAFSVRTLDWEITKEVDRYGT